MVHLSALFTVPAMLWYSHARWLPGPRLRQICQAHRQHCCRSACQISERSDNSKYKSRGFETLRDLTERRLSGYWDRAQVRVPYIHYIDIKAVFYCKTPNQTCSGPINKCIIKLVKTKPDWLDGNNNDDIESYVNSEYNNDNDHKQWCT